MNTLHFAGNFMRFSHDAHGTPSQVMTGAPQTLQREREIVSSMWINEGVRVYQLIHRRKVVT